MNYHLLLAWAQTRTIHLIEQAEIAIGFSFQKMAPTTGNEGPFHRVRDKRLVRQVLSTNHQPHHWMPMDITSTECKLMEVRKFSAEYHNIDVKWVTS